jgi:hypothetical protein
MKTNAALCFYLAISILVAASWLGAQQAPPSTTAPQSTSNSASMTEEQRNDADIQLMREDVRSQRKQIVAANLPLTDAEATKFWPVYDRYIADTVKLNDARYALIKEYAQNRDTMTPEQADSITKRWLALDQQNAELRLRYIPEFQKVISEKKTAMFFQIDRRLGMMIELQLASLVPLVKP